ncbi:MAG: hypothetical protein CME59_10000 [Halioglobus sp.]|nr:hypothetical protein [Halioglobus sp.]|tara:strand:+ start:2602 stop:3513 length:912 start_codon:yes stop_codon:yes gene_type:complete
MSRLCLLATCWLCLYLCACATLPGREAATLAFVEAQKTQARELRQQDRLADSLALWRTLLPLGAPDEETRRAIAELEKEIAAQTASNLRRARRAYAGGNTRQGDTWLLKVLALSPGHPEALERLGHTASERASAQQRNKSEQENRAAKQRAAPRAAYAPPDDSGRMRTLYEQGDFEGVIALGRQAAPAAGTRQAALLRQAHIALAERAGGAGRNELALEHLQAAMIAQPEEDDPLLARSLELRGALSRHWYEQGSRLLSSDLDAAVVALEKALQYNPYNANAQRKLAQAQTLQRNLQRIEGAR